MHNVWYPRGAVFNRSSLLGVTRLEDDSRLPVFYQHTSTQGAKCGSKWESRKHFTPVRCWEDLYEPPRKQHVRSSSSPFPSAELLDSEGHVRAYRQR